ncbi:bifunctional chorismate mutase/prephenate dehydratase [Oscillospiraceae bacterium OttesenSCG-928-F05]|nr:bifunctional chorismate mutase/prephenate dehydratase [Oscillospiraceae bacterium OttesenSCG-928-F05]
MRLDDPREKIRSEIDAADALLLSAFERRMRAAREMGRYKKAKGLPILDAEREKFVIESRVARLEDPSLAGSAEMFFTQLMRLSREAQASVAGVQPSVVCQGVPGSYGSAAVSLRFGRGYHRTHLTGFRDVTEAVAAGEAAYGVLPIENSTTGSIREVYDLILESGLYIHEEIILLVNHCLMSCKGGTLSGIKKVFSHEQGFLQSRRFLEKYPEMETVICTNTAAAAKLVAERGDPLLAAIAGREAAEIYGLQVLAEGIQDVMGNFTRFALLSAEKPERGSRMAATFTLKHEVGSLAQILSQLDGSGVNLVKIESIPLAETPWAYRFFVEMDGFSEETRSDLCADFRLLGRFDPVARK